MKLLTRLLSPRAEDDDGYYVDGSGVDILQFFGMVNGLVTPEAALQSRGVWAAVRYIADIMGSLPVITYRRLPKGKERARDHLVYPVLHRRPNHWQTPSQFWQMLVAHFVMRQKAYAEIHAPTIPGVPFELWPIHPARVGLPKRTAAGRLQYPIRQPDGTTRQLMQDEMLRVEGFTLDGVDMIGAVEVGAQGIGLDIALERFGALFFKNGANPGFVFKHPAKIGPQAAKNLEDSWVRRAGGVNVHRPIVAEEGMDVVKLTTPNDEAQFIEARQHQTEEDARLFRVPPHKIQHLLNATFSNIEHQAIETVVDTLRPIAVAIEQSISRDLIPDEDQEDVFAEFLLDALLRGDTTTRYGAYSKAITTGWMTRNEARELENMNPLDGLDEPLEPSNMANVGRNADQGGRDTSQEQNP